MRKLLELDRSGIILFISLSDQWMDKTVPINWRFRKERGRRVPEGWVCLEVVCLQVLIHLGVRLRKAHG